MTTYAISQTLSEFHHTYSFSSKVLSKACAEKHQAEFHHFTLFPFKQKNDQTKL